MSKKYITDVIKIDGQLLDGNGSAGTSGQVLSSTGTATDWVSLSEISGVDGTGTANYVAKWSDADTITNSVIYDNGTNVGIGTTNPATKLHILTTGTAVSSDGVSSLVVQKSAAAGTAAAINIVSGDSAEASIRFGDTTDQSMGALRYLNDLDAFSIVTNNNEQARITSAGNVGIGTTAPEGILQISKPSSTVYDGTSDSGQSNIGASVTIQNTNTTVNSFAQINMQVSASSNRAVGRIVTIARGSASSDMAFVTESFGVRAEKMRIDQTGNVGIGTDSPSTQLEIASNTAAGALKITQSAEVTGNAMVYIDNNSASNKPALRIDVTAGGNATDTHGVLINNSGPGYGLIVNGGNVGIGTTSPTQLLHVNSTTANPTGIGLQNSQRYYSVRSNNFSLVFTDETVGSERMRITSAGNVGIGTTSPDSKLDVRGTASGEIARFTTFNGSDSYIYIGRDDSTTEGLTLGYNSSNGDCTIKAVNGSHPIIFEQNTAERMRVASNGGVGINTTNPTEKLEVNGNVKVQGDIIVNSDIELGPSSRIQLDDTPTASTASGSGTIVNWSVSESTTAGTLYTVKSNGGWTTTDADIEAKSTGMLAIALGSNATAGMLLQGFFYKASHGFTIGLPLYISNTAGAFSTTRPTGTNDYVRIIGYATSANYIYFDPDKTWVKLQ